MLAPVRRASRASGRDQRSCRANVTVALKSAFKGAPIVAAIQRAVPTTNTMRSIASGSTRYIIAPLRSAPGAGACSSKQR